MPWFVVFSAGLFFFYSHIQLNIFNVINIQLMSYFHIEAESASKLSAMTLAAVVSLVVFSGMLIDRFSTKRIILTAMLFSCGGTILLATTQILAIAFVARFIIGIGSAFCFLSCIRLASRWFPTNKMALVTSILVAMATTGGMVAQKPAAVLASLYGWQNMLLLNVLLGIIIMIWILFFVKNFPAGYQIKEEYDKLLPLGLINSFKKAYFNGKNWIYGLYTSFLNLPFWILGAAWGSPFLIQIYHFDINTAAGIISMLYVGIIIGSPTFGLVVGKTSRKKILMYIGATASSILLIAIIYLPNLSIFELKILFFLEGFFTGAQILSYPMVAENSPKSLTATSVSVVSFATMGGGALFQIIFGILMDGVSKPNIINNIPVYPFDSYSIALSLLPITAFIALILVKYIHYEPSNIRNL